MGSRTAPAYVCVSQTHRQVCTVPDRAVQTAVSHERASYCHMSESVSHCFLVLSLSALTITSSHVTVIREGAG